MTSPLTCKEFGKSDSTSGLAFVMLAIFGWNARSDKDKNLAIPEFDLEQAPSNVNRDRLALLGGRSAKALGSVPFDRIPL